MFSSARAQIGKRVLYGLGQNPRKPEKAGFMGLSGSFRSSAVHLRFM
jgi:hypothetical protein